MSKKKAKKNKAVAVQQAKNQKQNNLRGKLMDLRVDFEDFMGDFFQMPSVFGEKFFREKEFITPSVSLSETRDGYKVKAELSGVNKNDIKLDLSGGYLTIKADKSKKDEEEGENYYRQECSYGLVQRTIRMPDDIDPNSVNAKYENGVLVVDIKKNKNLAKPAKRVEVK